MFDALPAGAPPPQQPVPADFVATKSLEQEETNACLPIEISADEQLQEAHALNAQMQAELEEFRRLRTPSHARMLDEFEDEYAILDETSQHKILGGGAAVEEVTCHELDFYKLHIANFLVQRISKFAERRRGGSISLALAIEASCDDDTGPIALHMRLTGECTGRGGKSSAGGGHSWSPHSLDASTRSVDSHGRRFDSQSPQRNSASSRFDSLASPRLPTSSRGSVRSPREMSMKSPRFRYSATNCDPKWGFRHEVDLNNEHGSLYEYKSGDDAPTLKAHTIIQPGTNVDWSIRIIRLGSKHASRFGVVKPNFLAKRDWYDNDLFGAAWYVTRNGVFNGANLTDDQCTKLRANDILGLHLSWTPDHVGCVRFTLNGQHIPCKLSQIQGPVQLACQLLNKGDSVVYIGEEISMGGSFANFSLQREGVGGKQRKTFVHQELSANSILPHISREMSSTRGEIKAMDTSTMDSAYVSSPNHPLHAEDGSTSTSAIVGSTLEEQKCDAAQDKGGEHEGIASIQAPALSGLLDQTDPGGDINSLLTKEDPVGSRQNIKNDLMEDVAKLQGELKLLSSERDQLRSELRRQLIQGTEKNEALQRMDGRLVAIEAQMREQSAQNDMLSRDVAQKTTLHNSVVKELESMRVQLYEHQLQAAHLQQHARETYTSNHDPDFDSAIWRENLPRQASGRDKVNRPLSASSAPKTPEEKKLFRAAERRVSSQAGLAGAGVMTGNRPVRNFVPSTRPRNSTAPGKRGGPVGGALQGESPEEMLLLAAGSNDTARTLQILSLVRNEERKRRMAARALLVAAKNGSEGVCKSLITLQNSRKMACETDTSNNVEFLCRKADVDAALFGAAQYGYASILDLLVENGASVHATDADGATPLILAAFHGQLKAVKRLLALGAQLDIADGDGYTALMWAAFKGRIDTAHALLEAGANPDSLSREGNTALIYAAFGGSRTMVNALVHKVSDVHRRNNMGMSAADVALQQGLHEIVALLRGEHRGEGGGEGGSSEEQMVVGTGPQDAGGK